MSTRKSILKQINRIFAMVVDEGILAKNPAKVVKVKVPETRKLVFNNTEIHTLPAEVKKGVIVFTIIGFWLCSQG